VCESGRFWVVGPGTAPFFVCDFLATVTRHWSRFVVCVGRRVHRSVIGRVNDSDLGVRVVSHAGLCVVPCG